MSDTTRHLVPVAILIVLIVYSNAQGDPNAFLSDGPGVVVEGGSSGGIVVGGGASGGFIAGGGSTGGVVAGGGAGGVVVGGGASGGFVAAGGSAGGIATGSVQAGANTAVIQVPPLNVGQIVNLGTFLNRQDYQGAPVYWGNYGLWSNCRGTCGIGYRLRQRRCYATITSVSGEFVVTQSTQQFVQTGVVGGSVASSGGVVTGEVIGAGTGIPIGPGSTLGGTSVVSDTGLPQSTLYQTGGVIGGETVVTGQQYTTDTSGVVPQIDPRFNTGCVGTLVQAEGCNLGRPCIVVGRWGRWTDWSICSAQCGGGTQSRSRNCEGGTTCPPGESSQTQSCNIQPCVGVWNRWQEWSLCTTACGGGTQTRIRTCSTTNCIGVASETRNCNLTPCQGRWSAWGVYDECTVTCGGGTRSRYRTCIGEQNCIGPAIETIVCNPQSCYGTYTEWGVWTACSRDCGGGTRTQYRECVGGPECQGPSSRTEQCNLQPCITYVWGAWTQWGTCTATCGEGTYTRSRPCLYGETVADASQCVSLYGGSGIQTNPCFAKPCLSLGQWSEWSGCFPTCGAGQQTRSRPCFSNGQPTLVAGACQDIGITTQTQQCTLGPCWAYSEWESWGPCSESCGDGFITRVRGCLSNGNPYLLQGGLTCGSLAVFSETKPCFISSCYSWRQWSEWTSCSATCGPGEITRARVCVADGVRSIAPNLCKNYGSGKALERRSCNNGPCFSWGRWSRWSDCNTPCGQGETVRTRDCFADGQKASSNNGCLQQGGLAIETRVCNGQPCYKWGRWTTWSVCSAACGLGETTRSRACESLLPGPVSPGSCDNLDGLGSFQTNKCSLGPCYTWDRWTEWTQCSVSCGSGQITRSRRCLADGQAINDASLCPSPDGVGPFESRPCQLERCYRWARWTDWTLCSAPCGQGEITRSRRCVDDDGNDAPSFDRCPADRFYDEYDGSSPNFQRQICNLGPCYRWTRWTVWSSCPVTCGSGQIRRSRRCVTDGDIDAPGYGSCANDADGRDYEQVQPCILEQCYAWSVWDDWGTCSAPCGTGQVTRSRRCIGQADRQPAPSSKCGGGAGSDFQSQPCSLGPCYQWLRWSEWSRCSAPCGPGTITRSRRCVTVGSEVDAPSYDLCGSDLYFESQPCQIDVCYRWTRWDEWSTCSVTCGDGQISRSRRCVDDNGNDGPVEKCSVDSLDVKTFEFRPCNPGACYMWMRWSEWSTCSAPCGQGTTTRSRRCVAVGSENDAPSYDLCGSDLYFESQPCQIDVCYRWTRWTEWTSCPVSCGTGQISRSRRCVDDNGNDGPVEKCSVDSFDIKTFEVQSCRIQACYRWSVWTVWTTCSATCGDGFITRSRTCDGDDGSSGTDDRCYVGEERDSFQQRPCNNGPCYYLAAWSLWSKCTRSCGEGIRTRSRSCMSVSSGAVESRWCQDFPGEKFDNEDCNLGPCHQFTAWGSWSRCTVPCGSGEQSRRRTCETVSGVPVSDSQCSTDRRDFILTIKCIKLDCPGNWNGWGEWSRCTATCNSGSQVRVRTCSNYKCNGRSRETRVCNDVECIPIEDSGTWSAWTSWSSCGGRCGISEQTRICIGGQSCGGEEYRRTRECCPTDDGGIYVTGGSSGGFVSGGSSSSGGFVISGGSSSSSGGFVDSGGSASGGGGAVISGGSSSGGVVVTGGSSGSVVTTTTFQCTADAGSRQDCGFEGIGQDTCILRECCWDDSIPGVPWCYRPDGYIGTTIVEGATSGGSGEASGGSFTTGGGGVTSGTSSSGSLFVVTDGSGTSGTLTQTGTDGVTTTENFEGNPFDLELTGGISVAELERLGISIPGVTGGDMMDKDN